MKLKMKDILKQTEFYVFCIIVAFAGSIPKFV